MISNLIIYFYFQSVKGILATELNRGDAMLNAFQKKLDALILDPDDKFERHVRERFGRNLPKGLAEELKSFVRLLPKIERRIFSLYVWLPPTSKVKEVGSHFLAYMYQPEDFLPENVNMDLIDLFGEIKQKKLN